jgi:polar amino acid transport system substrate-binding protein
MAALLVPTFVVSAQNRGEIHIVTENYPPYEMADPVNGQKGFDFDVATEVFRLLGYAPKIKFLPWKRALRAARLGEAVGILTCAYRKEREEFILFSDPISNFTNGFFTRADFEGPSPTLIEDVKGRSVASITAYESLTALKELGIMPKEVPDTVSGVKMLLASRFDYLYVSQHATEFAIKDLGLAGRFRFHPIITKDFHFCFSKAYPEVDSIAEEFRNALKIIRANGTYEKIHSQYR